MVAGVLWVSEAGLVTADFPDSCVSETRVATIAASKG